jgi:hypothetical protein
MHKLSAIGLVILMLAGVCYGIQISGDVWGEWSAADNPYEVIGNLRVPPESTLIIGPGCYIVFAGHYQFAVDSARQFLALGTEDDSITFTAPDTTIGWLGLRINSVSGNCALSFCIIEWAKIRFNDPENFWTGAGIFCRNTDLSISHSSLRYNSTELGYGGGLYCIHSYVNILECQIISNHAAFGGAGVCIDSSGADIINCFFGDNLCFHLLGGEEGGAISGLRSSVNLTGNKINTNISCTRGGGGVFFGK